MGVGSMYPIALTPSSIVFERPNLVNGIIKFYRSKRMKSSEPPGHRWIRFASRPPYEDPVQIAELRLEANPAEAWSRWRFNRINRILHRRFTCRGRWVLLVGNFRLSFLSFNRRFQNCTHSGIRRG